MDVHRSFYSSKTIDHSSLINILQVYACYNPNVEYCQGMNFIVGFLYILCRDNSRTFSFLQALIKKYDMENLYSQNVPLLKKHFYQMDRVLYDNYPNLSIYFRNEGIKANFFSPTWFITLFTNSMQYNNEDMPSSFLLEIWDAFLLYGWKAIYKVGIFIIGMLEKELTGAKSEQIMVTFGDLSKGKIFNDQTILKEFRKQLKHIKVTDKILEVLSGEYESIISKTTKKKSN